MTWDWYVSNLKGVRNPKEPRWKAITGGTLSYNQQRNDTIVMSTTVFKKYPKKAVCLKKTTGEWTHTWKSEDAYSRVPSPPRQMMKSTRLEMSSRSEKCKDNKSFKYPTEDLYWLFKIYIVSKHPLQRDWLDVVPSLKVQNFLVMAPKFSSPEMAGSSKTFFST